MSDRVKYKTEGVAVHCSLFAQLVSGSLTQDIQDFLVRSEISNYIGVGVVIIVCGQSKSFFREISEIYHSYIVNLFLQFSYTQKKK